MSVATKKRASAFSRGQAGPSRRSGAITDNGLVWRKLKDGSGSWQYDFTENGGRRKGNIDLERDGVTLSQARRVLANLKAQAVLDQLSRKSGASVQASRPFKDVAADYLVWSKTHLRDHRHNVGRMDNHLIPRLGSKRLGDITIADVERLRTELLEQDLTQIFH